MEPRSQRVFRTSSFLTRWRSWVSHVHLGADNAGYYSTAPLEHALLQISWISHSSGEAAAPLQLEAASRDNQPDVLFRQPRNRDRRRNAPSWHRERFTLPPPPRAADGELYWDGGILSNTPAEVVFDGLSPPRFAGLRGSYRRNPAGPEPETMWEVLHRQKDIQYSSRVASQLSSVRPTFIASAISFRVLSSSSARIKAPGSLSTR